MAERGSLRSSIIECFDKAQTSTVHHPKLLKSLAGLHGEADLARFFEAFIDPLCAALVVGRKEPAVERALDFVAKFAACVAPLDSVPGSDGEEVVGERSIHHTPTSFCCCVTQLCYTHVCLGLYT